MTKDEALRKALEALEEPKEHIAKHRRLEAITAIKEVLAQPEQDEKFCDANCVWTDHHPDCKLAQPEQEPVAVVNGVYANRIEWKCTPKFFPADGTNLYTTPPQRKPLSDEEISRIWGSYFSRGFEFARAIEAAHGIKE